MRDFFKVSPTVWRSRKFKSLPDMAARQVYLYLLTCPHGNSAGCYDLPPMYACADLDMTEEVYRKSIESLLIAGLIHYDRAENTLWIVNFEHFNEPTNPKHALGLLIQLGQASSERLRAIAFHRFLEVFKAKNFDKDAALKKAIETLLIDYPKPILTKTESKSEIETESRVDLDETETREKSRAPLVVAALTGDACAAQGAGEPELPEIPHHLLRTPLMKRSA